MKVTKFMRAAAFSLCSLAVVGCTEEATPAPITSQLELRDDMRELWTAHTTWTRVVLMSAIAGLPDTGPASERLLANQDDIGDALRPFYGDAAADQLTALLHEHINLAITIVGAAARGDDATFQTANAEWYANADQIAHFLADACPFLAYDELHAMMNMHLDQTLLEATARFDENWQLDVAMYDAIVRHILHMSDAISDGLERQFPDLVAATVMSSAEESQHLRMTELWQDQVTWTRVYLISTLAHLPDADVAAVRLLNGQIAFGDLVRDAYGDAAADQLIVLQQKSVYAAFDVFRAVESRDDGQLQAASTDWHQNADQLARYFSTLTSQLDVEGLRSSLSLHVDRTTAEAMARDSGAWGADIESYDSVVTNILDTSDVLSGALAAEAVAAPQSAP